MIIKDNRTKKAKYGTLLAGAVFVYDEDFYIRTRGNMLSVNLQSGECRDFDLDDLVENLSPSDVVLTLT